MKVLVIDDEENIRRTLRLALLSMEQQPFEAPDEETALQLIAREGIQVAFLDLRLARGVNGLEVLPRLISAAPNLHVVVFTANASIPSAVDAMKLGATDYVEKPFTPDQIRLVLHRIETTRKLQDRVAELEVKLAAGGPSPEPFTSASPRMREVLETARKAAPAEAGILILGESGTGKTLLAGEIHRCSKRREHKFVTVSCPTLTKELLAADLFGHVRGAFTGAVSDSWGKVTVADGGTLFFDEIGDLPLDLQPKLLRLLQEREYERVGEPTARRADVRVVAASNHNLEQAVREGRFREDLFYRLNVITLSMPSLRERKEDLETMVTGFVAELAPQCGKKIERVADSAWRQIRDYDWPGNVRELRNVLERAVILSDGPELTLRLPGFAAGGPAAPAGEEPKLRAGELISLQALENAHIRGVVERTGTLEEAAAVLGINKATLYRKRKRLG